MFICRPPISIDSTAPINKQHSFLFLNITRVRYSHVHHLLISYSYSYTAIDVAHHRAHHAVFYVKNKLQNLLIYLHSYATMAQYRWLYLSSNNKECTKNVYYVLVSRMLNKSIRTPSRTTGGVDGGIHSAAGNLLFISVGTWSYICWIVRFALNGKGQSLGQSLDLVLHKVQQIL